MLNCRSSSPWAVLALLVAALALAGCVEQDVLVKVKKDGSGTLVVRLLVSPQILSAMQTGRKGATLSLYDKRQAVAQAALLGQGVTFVRGKAIEGRNEKRTWRGMMVEYNFTNVNQLNLSNLKLGDGASMPNTNREGWSFAYQPGETNVLTIKPQFTLLDAGLTPVRTPGPGAGPEGGAPPANPPKLEQLRALFAGMRFSVYVRVDGEIVETDATHRLQSYGDTIPLLDFRMDKVLESEEALRALQAMQPGDGMQGLLSAKFPGVTFQDPRKELRISFR